MKKKILLLSALVATMLSVMGLTACSGNGANNSEFKEYEKIVTDIKENSVDKLKDVSVLTQSIQQESLQNSVAASIDGNKIFEIIEASSTKADIEIIQNFFNDIFEQSAFIPVICGEVIVEIYKADKFYNVPIYITGWEQYVSTESQGTLKHSEVYMPADYSWTGNDLYVFINFDYRSKSDFSFDFLQFDADFTSVKYAYGNSSMEFFSFSREFYNDEMTFEALSYRSGEGRKTGAKEVVDACMQYIESEFKQADLDSIRKKLSDFKYNITSEEFSLYSEKYLGDASEIEDTKSTFIIVDETVMGYHAAKGDTASILTLPSNASAVYADLYLPASTKKLIIPSNIKSIKIEEYRLSESEKPTNETTDKSNLVECSAKYFSIQMRTQDGVNNILKEIELQGDSEIFSTENHCLYSKDNTLLYVPENKNITTLKLDGSSISEFLIYGIFPQLYLPNLKYVDSTKGVDTREDGTLIEYDPFESLISSELRVKDYSFENVVLRGLSGNAELYLGGINGYTENSIRNIDKIYLYNTDSDNKSNLTVNITCPINNVYVNENFERLSFILSHSGSIKEISLSSDILKISLYTETNVKVVLPWSQLTFAHEIKRFSLFGLNEDSYRSLGWSYDTNEHDLQDRNITVVFQPLSESEKTDAAILDSFRTVMTIPENESEYGYAFMQIDGYHGDGPAIRVPEYVLGYPVAKFALNNYHSEGNLTIEEITELYLPATLKILDTNVDHSLPYFTLSKIVYDGTKEQFNDIVGGINNIYQILMWTEKIVCTDGEFNQQSNKEKYLFADEDGNTLSVIADWSDWLNEQFNYVLEAELNYNGMKFKDHKDSTHSFNFSFEDNSEIWHQINLSIRPTMDNIINRKIIDVAIYYDSVIKDFSLVSIEDVEGEAILHDYDRYGICCVCGYSKDIKYYGARWEIVVKAENTSLVNAKILGWYRENSTNIINEQSFKDCKALTSVIIPQSINTVVSGAFSDCTNLTDIWYEGQSIPDSWDDLWLNGCDATVHLSGTWEYVDGVPTIKNNSI